MSCVSPLNQAVSVSLLVVVLLSVVINGLLSSDDTFSVLLTSEVPEIIQLDVFENFVFKGLI